MDFKKEYNEISKKIMRPENLPKGYLYRYCFDVEHVSKILGRKPKGNNMMDNSKDCYMSQDKIIKMRAFVEEVSNMGSGEMGDSSNDLNELANFAKELLKDIDS